MPPVGKTLLCARIGAGPVSTRVHRCGQGHSSWYLCPWGNGDTMGSACAAPHPRNRILSLSPDSASPARGELKQFQATHTYAHAKLHNLMHSRQSHYYPSQSALVQSTSPEAAVNSVFDCAPTPRVATQNSLKTAVWVDQGCQDVIFPLAVDFQEGACATFYLKAESRQKPGAAPIVRNIVRTDAMQFEHIEDVL